MRFTLLKSDLDLLKHEDLIQPHCDYRIQLCKNIITGYIKIASFGLIDLRVVLLDSPGSGEYHDVIYIRISQPYVRIELSLSRYFSQVFPPP